MKWSSPSMEKVMNIVVATDGSEAAIGAARQSMDLLRPGARVVLVMVIPEYEDPMEDAGGLKAPRSATSKPRGIGRRQSLRANPHSIARRRCSNQTWRCVWFRTTKKRGPPLSESPAR